MELKDTIRSIPDFPKKGIMFRDITTLLQNKDALKKAVAQFVNYYSDKHIDLVVGPESRGFIFGAILAHQLHAGFIPVRKPGKLPYKILKKEYSLEYGNDSIEIHEDAIKKGQNILIVDDLLATGGTAKAALELVESMGGNVVSLAFLIELSFLNGRDKLSNKDVFSLIDYKSEE
ncbi:adenine phosphoribosyltransferase [Candidatus Woesearchaeota archaeon]|nr:adenine phosphoribosyltransferase [Candidatus Woesearchaeota archaeon]